MLISRCAIYTLSLNRRQECYGSLHLVFTKWLVLGVIILPYKQVEHLDFSEEFGMIMFCQVMRTVDLSLLRFSIRNCILVFNDKLAEEPWRHHWVYDLNPYVISAYVPFILFCPLRE
jgi:hypothetical protein